MSKESSSNSALTKLETKRSWKDLTIKPEKFKQVKRIESWLFTNHNSTNRDNGHLAMFYGPSKTGKTLSANLLGKHTKKDVYKIDFTLVISEYIGETEKNINQLFDDAEKKGWILFFDEADAIFGKRTQAKGTHDKYANQEVSYLLQRIENHPGLIIFSSKQEINIGDSSEKQFDTIIEFEKLSKTERRLIWFKKLFSK